MKRIYAIWLSILLVISSVVSVVSIQEAGSAPVYENQINYTPHGTIYIDGDADFATQAAIEPWPGSGTQGDPYLIENYEIDASSTHGIRIRNTNVFFIIRDSLIQDGGNNNEGIYIDNIKNGIVDNCTVTNNKNGIYVWSSELTSINNNTCNSNNYNGIYLIFSNSITLFNNTANTNQQSGIFVYQNNVDNNYIYNNTLLTNTEYGLKIEESIKNKIENNTISDNNGLYIIYKVVIGSASIFFIPEMSFKEGLLLIVSVPLMEVRPINPDRSIKELL